MPVLPGFTVTSPTQSSDFTRISSELNEFGLDNFPYHESVVGNVVGSASAGSPPVTLESRGIPGDLAHRYLDDFYYRVHIVPNPSELGTLLADQTVDIEVWNAWFTGQSLTSVDQLNTDGITFIEPQIPPTTFTPLESRGYQLYITISGPPEINASYTFNFALDTPVLKVTGKRATPWPFRPNWESPVKEKLGWLTGLQVSYNGREQARSLRTVPRRFYEYNILEITDRVVNALVWKTAGGLYALPIWHDRATLTSDTVVNTSTIYLDTTHKDFSVNGYVILLKTPTDYLTQKIVAMTDTSLTLVDNLTEVWAEGVEVYPIKTARLQKAQDSRGLNPQIQKLTVKFEVTDLNNWTAVDSIATYRTHPVFSLLHNWKDNKILTIRRKLSVLDSDTGVVTYDDEAGIAMPEDSYKLLLIGTVAIVNFRAWLYARKGKTIPIWVPTQTNDIKVVGDVGAADTSLTVDYLGYTEGYAQEVNRRDIRIELFDGTVFYRRLISSSVATDTEILVMDSVLGVDVPATEIRQVSFMMFARLSSDSIELVWLNSEVVKVAIKFVGKLDDV